MSAKAINEAIEAGVRLWPDFEPFSTQYFNVAKWAEIESVRANSMFIAQMAHETAGFTKLEENLNYSKERLIMVWPSRFRLGMKNEKIVDGVLHDGKYAAALIGGQPEMIANIVYGNRYGNGGPETGDGWMYRGRGPIQLTFLDNYAKFQYDCGFRQELSGKGDWIEDPDILLDPDVGIWSAGWFWREKKIVPYADAGNVLGVTRRINGGQNGIEDRVKKYNRMLELMGKWKT